MTKFFICVALFLLSFSVFPNVRNTELPHDGYIIKYRNIPIPKEINSENFIRDLNIEIVKELPESILKDDNIEYIEPNFIYTIETVPNDPRYDDQYAHQRIESERAWDFTVGSKDVVVAVIDTGVDHNHKDLKDNMWVNEAELNGEEGVDDDGNGFVDDIHGYDFVNSDGDPMDDQKHGTHCAGIIGAKHNDKGIAGVNSDVKIMAVKFLSARGSGTTANAIKSIKYAVDNGARILSNSWGGGGFSQALYDMIDYAKQNDVLFVAAAGNSNTDRPHYPSGYGHDNVISVASSDANDDKSGFSNYGLPHVDIAAPGSSILSTVLNNKYAYLSGTSMATPYVSGAAALMLAEQDMDYSSLKSRIFKTSDYLPKKWKKYVETAGRLNVGNLLEGVEPTRPPKPVDGAWVKQELSIESDHPYESNKTYSFEFDIPEGAKFLRVHFEKVDTEARFDLVTLVAGDSSTDVSGKYEDYSTDYLCLEDDQKAVLTLKSDYSVEGWGFKVDFFEYQ